MKFAGASDNTANSIATFSDICLGLVGGGAGLFKVLNKGTKVADSQLRRVNLIISSAE